MKAVIFDLDGTLCDTVPLCLAAFKNALQPLVGDVKDDAIVNTFGPTEHATIKALAPNNIDEGVAQYWFWYKALHPMCPALFDGVADVLDFLKTKEVVLGLVTGKGEHSAKISLDYYGITSYFDAMKFGSPTAGVKDAKIAEIVEAYGLNKAEVLYVGDTATDVHACRKAGIKVAGALWAQGTDRQAVRQSRPDVVFETVDEFKRYLQRVIE